MRHLILSVLALTLLAGCTTHTQETKYGADTYGKGSYTPK